ncbi:MAG: sugar ABC transporter permease [Erysipelotrichaceae bacterium]|jgi:multiple sugar transport system permease protein|nr:sugar ABC transporter permease [Erysipelotrichaceae bacterium]
MTKSPLKSLGEALLYLSPFLLGVIIFSLYPVANVFLISFKEGYRMATGAFQQYGLGNYTRVLADKDFILALKNTGLYVLFVVPISTALAILFAALLNQKIRFTGLFQTAYFLPMVTSGTAVGLAWKWMYNYDYGIFNYLLSLIGVSPINFLNDVRYGLLSLIIFGIWSMLPFTIILLLAGMQNIDPLYYTAAKVDGAKTTKTFFRITVPLLAPTIGLVLIINMINAFKVCSELFPLFNGKPGVAYSLYTVVFYIYDEFFLNRQLATAGAAAVILFFIVFVLTMVQLFIQRKWKHY